MLEAGIQQIRSEFSTLTREELLELLVTTTVQKRTLEAGQAENEKVCREMAILYDKEKKRVEKLEAENRELRKQNEHLTSLEALRTKALFGRSTEKSGDLFRMNAPEEDPLAEEEPADGSISARQGAAGGNPEEQKKDAQHVHPHRASSGDRRDSGQHGRPGRRPVDLSRLPHRTVYDLDVQELNSKYGEGNWTIKFWRHHDKVERTRPLTFVQRTYEPVIAAGNERDSTYDLIALPYPDDILPGSCLSLSLAVSLLYGKYAMAVPFQRQIRDLQADGLFLTEQTVTSWAQKLESVYLRPVAEFMVLCLKARPYQQCDETTHLVIRDGRPVGSRSYIWVHLTSEMDEGPAIAVFCYEKTRAAQHLRNFFGAHSRVRFITCDAYTAYRTFEKEQCGRVAVAGCMMHARRRWAEALSLVDRKKLTEEQIGSLPESRALALIGAIYMAEGRLKTLTPCERLKQRRKRVLPLVNRYFSFVRSIDTADPAVGERVRDAVTYSLNQEKYLRRFLEDGRIPPDDGFTERQIRSYAVGRRSWLFSCTPAGAACSMTYYTLIETARLNNAQPYVYLKYVFEQMIQLGPFCRDKKKLQNLMPWSAEYRRYEKTELDDTAARYLPPDDIMPASPKMKSRRKRTA